MEEIINQEREGQAGAELCQAQAMNIVSLMVPPIKVSQN
jgi:hypothetical protein